LILDASSDGTTSATTALTVAEPFNEQDRYTMDNTGYVSLSRQAAIRRQMEVIANNIANASTPAFKSERLIFSEFLAKGADGGPPVSFVQDTAVIRDMSEGVFSETRNPLDLAIQGDGYFVIEGPSEPYYTRNGRFHINEDGQLANSANMPLLGEDNKPISITGASGRIEIAKDGTITTDGGVIGRVQIVRFESEQDLRPISNALFRADKAPMPAADAKVLQGAIEESNVQPIVETTNMIEALRSYQNSHQMVQNEHERILKAIEVMTHAS
jgi:flagellar basal-body rod protein FlgF